MSRPSSYKREYLTDHEVANTAAPGGRLPVKGAKNATGRGGDWTSISDGSPAAAAAAQERHEARAKPELAAKRERAGK
jgi:hypothetical protein